MNFLEYKNYLINNNIHLFDYDYRNSYQNIFLLIDNINKNETNIQTGGANVFYLSPFTVIKRIGESKNDIKKLNLLIDNLVLNNISGAKYLCQNELTLFA